MGHYRLYTHNLKKHMTEQLNIEWNSLREITDEFANNHKEFNNAIAYNITQQLKTLHAKRKNVIQLIREHTLARRRFRSQLNKNHTTDIHFFAQNSLDLKCAKRMLKKIEDKIIKLMRSLDIIHTIENGDRHDCDGATCVCEIMY